MFVNDLFDQTKEKLGQEIKEMRKFVSRERRMRQLTDNGRSIRLNFCWIREPKKSAEESRRNG